MFPDMPMVEFWGSYLNNLGMSVCALFTIVGQLDTGIAQSQWSSLRVSQARSDSAELALGQLRITLSC